jgi:hypothetical protein
MKSQMSAVEQENKNSQEKKLAFQQWPILN